MKTEQSNTMTIKLVSIKLSTDQRRGPDATGVCNLSTGKESGFTVDKNWNEKEQPIVHINRVDGTALQALGITLDVTEIQTAFLELIDKAEVKRKADVKIGLGLTYDKHPLHIFSVWAKNFGWVLSQTREEFVEAGNTWLNLKKTIEYKKSTMEARIEFDAYRGWYELTVNHERVKRSKKYQNIQTAYTAAVACFKTIRDSQITEMKQKEETKNELSTLLDMEVENVREWKSSSSGRKGYHVSRRKVMIKKAKETYNDKYILFNKGSEPNTIRVDKWVTGDITIDQFKKIINILQLKDGLKK